MQSFWFMRQRKKKYLKSCEIIIESNLSLFQFLDHPLSLYYSVGEKVIILHTFVGNVNEM